MLLESFALSPCPCCLVNARHWVQGSNAKHALSLCTSERSRVWTRIFISNLCLFKKNSTCVVTCEPYSVSQTIIFGYHKYTLLSLSIRKPRLLIMYIKKKNCNYVGLIIGGYMYEITSCSRRQHVTSCSRRLHV